MDNTPQEFVQITREQYQDLLDSELRLLMLEAAGVDNWQGFDYAMEMYREEKAKQGSEAD